MVANDHDFLSESTTLAVGFLAHPAVDVFPRPAIIFQALDRLNAQRGDGDYDAEGFAGHFVIIMWNSWSRVREITRRPSNQKNIWPADPVYPLRFSMGVAMTTTQP